MNLKLPIGTVEIAPSILSADFSCLGQGVATLDKEGVKVLHLDIMDGHFVPNISFGPCVITSLRPCTEMLFDVHLMIGQTDRYLEIFAKAGADLITVHLESLLHDRLDPKQVFKAIRALGKYIGLSINPGTPVEKLLPYMAEIDLALVMTVEPGFGGQKLQVPVLEKVSILRDYLKKNCLRCSLEVDGGINESNITAVVNAGADLLVCGSVLFGKKDLAGAYRNLLGLLR